MAKQSGTERAIEKLQAEIDLLVNVRDRLVAELRTEVADVREPKKRGRKPKGLPKKDEVAI